MRGSVIVTDDSGEKKVVGTSNPLTGVVSLDANKLQDALDEVQEPPPPPPEDDAADPPEPAHMKIMTLMSCGLFLYLLIFLQACSTTVVLTDSGGEKKVVGSVNPLTGAIALDADKLKGGLGEATAEEPPPPPEEEPAE
ncbi:hypothetical protein HPB52_017109 [Rhipicephalus sanguineus]|uniref:Uncharacterized protein n=1 Tax=Rhipicephalus sanguineus TaxID=34632 RepID=A0A9D4PWU2_RHISA|nr:hypothetical protein HPB52_017109 [Rhipicephalus sanguineus]